MMCGMKIKYLFINIHPTFRAASKLAESIKNCTFQTMITYPVLPHIQVHSVQTRMTRKKGIHLHHLHGKIRWGRIFESAISTRAS